MKKQQYKIGDSVVNLTECCPDGKVNLEVMRGGEDSMIAYCWCDKCNSQSEEVENVWGGTELKLMAAVEWNAMCEERGRAMLETQLIREDIKLKPLALFFSNRMEVTDENGCEHIDWVVIVFILNGSRFTVRLEDVLLDAIKMISHISDCFVCLECDRDGKAKILLSENQHYMEIGRAKKTVDITPHSMR